MSETVRVLDRPAAGWSALVRDDPGATPAHRPELWDALADAIPGGRAGFVAVESRDMLVGGMGIVVERRAGFEWLHALPWLLGSAPLALSNRHAEVDAACAAALASWIDERRPVGGEWAFYRAEGPPADDARLERVPGETTHVETARVRLDAGIDAARARLGGRLRQYLRNAPTALAFADEPQALEEAYVLHARQARGWPDFTPLPLELSRRLLAVGREPGADARRDSAAAAGPAPATTPGIMPPLAHLFTLRDEGRLLAATLFLDHPRELFAWWSGISPRARGHHVFPVLLWRAIEWAAANGRARVNLGGSAGRASLIAFKTALGAEDVRFPVRWIRPSGVGLSRWIARLQAWRRRRRPRGQDTTLEPSLAP